MSLKVDLKHARSFVSEKDIEAISSETREAFKKLNDTDAEYPGSEMRGWLTLPEDYDKDEFERIKKAARRIRETSDVLVVIGIGGSYLGARAAIEFIKSKNRTVAAEGETVVVFAGNTLSSSKLCETLDFLKDKDFSVNVISKSGTTTEPSIAFRIFKELLLKRYGEAEAARRIYATTDAKKGKLKELADKNGYETFVIPDNIGGRYSVLTAVGLLPIAVAGGDIDSLMKGAAEEMTKLREQDVLTNDACVYAAVRNILYRSGKVIELSVSYEPDYAMMNEWWKQLFGESEGKEQKGLFPASAIYSTDLHSLGQYVQQGSRIMFETVVTFREPKDDIEIGFDETDTDGLNFLAGKKLSYVNKTACQATAIAHVDGDVPNVFIKLDRMDEDDLGRLIYFFETACAVSGFILGINPFDQPGVETYKRDMFALLGKPGYESEATQLRARADED